MENPAVSIGPKNSDKTSGMQALALWDTDHETLKQEADKAGCAQEAKRGSGQAPRDLVAIRFAHPQPAVARHLGHPNHRLQPAGLRLHTPTTQRTPLPYPGWPDLLYRLGLATTARVGLGPTSPRRARYLRCRPLFPRAQPQSRRATEGPVSRDIDSHLRRPPAPNDRYLNLVPRNPRACAPPPGRRPGSVLGRQPGGQAAMRVSPLHIVAQDLLELLDDPLAL